MVHQPGFPQTYRVVTCFLMRDSRILLLRRSDKVGIFKGKWAGVSGFIETEADKQSLLEIYEETGLDASEVKMLARGMPFEIEDNQNGVTWVIHPYLYEARGDEPISIDWEHFEYKWVEPGELSAYDTVPGLAEALARVYPPGNETNIGEPIS